MLSTSSRRSPVIASIAAMVALLSAGCGGADDSVERSTEPERTRPRAVDAPPAPPPRGEDGHLSPMEVHHPQIANLDADLLEAVQAAFQDATVDGVEFWVTSGWRSRAEQQRLLDEAIARYGSREEALETVATPDTSAHVTGDAVDIGPTDADSWLMQHGSNYGLCQTFANEMWHFELAVTPGEECPAPLPDGSHR